MERRESGSKRGKQLSDSRLAVEDEAGRRPFMRGIMIHSLMSRGISFEDAFETANRVRDGLKGEGVVTRGELATAIRDLLGELDAPEEAQPLPPPVMIREKGQRRGTPFSKGLLSQSLLAAAIDPQDAFDVALEIEGELSMAGLRECERRDLRRLAFETLRRRLGENPAQRYLVWRHYQSPDRPVMILLGGAPGAGKTTLSLEVARRLGIWRVLSTDSIRQILRLVLSRELVPAIHASSFDAYRVAGDAIGDSPVIEGFRSQASIVSVGARAMMDRAVEENTSMVMDGVSLVPGLIDLSAYDDKADVISVVIANLDTDAYRERFESRARERTPQKYLENLTGILEIQEYFLESADQFGVPIVDNASFEKSVRLILRHVTDTLRKKGQFDAAALL